MTVEDLINLLIQFPEDTPVVVIPDYEAGGRAMWRTRNVVQVNDQGQPVYIGVTTDCLPPREQRP